jgi:DNA invertase Pin-like site-specific DNA recombinase
MQLNELREFASRREWSVIGEYVDEGVSGSKESRPALNRLMADALADLDAYEVAFISLRDNLDLTTPTGRLMFQVIGAMAEFELSLTKERVRCGLDNARANGKQLGRPRRVVDRNTILRMKAEGVSLRDIATAVGLGYGTVRSRLQQVS